MKIKKLLPLAGILFLAIGSIHASAGTGTHGGTGIQLPNNPKIYLFDLVEKDLHLNPYFKGLKPKKEYVDRVDAALGLLKNVPADKIASKLQEIEELNSASAILILRTIESYNWYRSPLQLAEIKIPDSVIDWDALKLAKGLKYQVATRQDRTITVNGQAWDGMDDNSRAALIFHEIFYAMTSPTEIKGLIDRTKLEVFEQQPKYAREFTAAIFSSRMKLGRSAITNIFRDGAMALPIFGHSKFDTLRGHQIDSKSKYLCDAPRVTFGFSSSLYPFEDIKTETFLKSSKEQLYEIVAKQCSRYESTSNVQLYFYSRVDLWAMKWDTFLNVDGRSEEFGSPNTNKFSDSNCMVQVVLTPTKDQCYDAATKLIDSALEYLKLYQ